MVKESPYTEEWIRSHYQEYIQSTHWKDLKERYRKSGLRQSCFVCATKGRPHLHHRTYARVGRERLTDLVILCSSCHLLVHTEMQIRLETGHGRRTTLWGVTKAMHRIYRGKKGASIIARIKRKHARKRKGRVVGNSQ